MKSSQVRIAHQDSVFRFIREMPLATAEFLRQYTGLDEAPVDVELRSSIFTETAARIRAISNGSKP